MLKPQCQMGEELSHVFGGTLRNKGTEHFIHKNLRCQSREYMAGAFGNIAGIFGKSLFTICWWIGSLLPALLQFSEGRRHPTRNCLLSFIADNKLSMMGTASLQLQPETILVGGGGMTIGQSAEATPPCVLSSCPAPPRSLHPLLINATLCAHSWVKCSPHTHSQPMLALLSNLNFSLTVSLTPSISTHFPRLTPGEEPLLSAPPYNSLSISLYSCLSPHKAGST